jgi:hypothetical protein
VSSSAELAIGARCLLSGSVALDVVRTWPNQNVSLCVHVAFTFRDECKLFDLTSQIALQFRLLPVAERLQILGSYSAASDKSKASYESSILLWSSEINFSSMVSRSQHPARSEMWLPLFLEGVLGLQACRDYPSSAVANGSGFERSASFCYAGHALPQQVLLKASWSSCQVRLTVMDVGSEDLTVGAMRMFDTLKHAMPRSVHVTPDFDVPVATAVLQVGIERLSAESSSTLDLHNAKNMLQQQSSTDSLCCAINFFS